MIIFTALNVYRFVIHSPFSTKISAAESKIDLIAYIVAGYPNPDETVDLLLSMQQGGATTIQLGVPFANPHVDGTAIQKANKAALAFKVTIQQSINMVATARTKGLRVPVVLMGYIDPFMAFGIENLMDSCKNADIGGLSIVDTTAKQEKSVIEIAASHGISYAPVVTPTTTSDHIKYLSSSTGSFLQCVSLSDVTGVKMESALDRELKEFMIRVRTNSKLPLAACFGICTPSQVTDLSALADGIVIGSAIIRTIEYALDKTPEERAAVLMRYITALSAALTKLDNTASAVGTKSGKIASAVDIKSDKTVSSVDTKPRQSIAVKQTVLTVSAPNKFPYGQSGRDKQSKYKILQSDLSIEEIFDDWKINLSGIKVKSFVNERLQECSLRQVCHLMRLLGKKSRNGTHLHLKRHLPAVASSLETLSVINWSLSDIAAVLYGLQCLKNEDDGCLWVLHTVTTKLKVISSEQILTAINLSMIMIGLQGMSSDDEEVRSLVSALATLVDCRSGNLNGRAVGNALYGLQGMSNDNVEVRSLVSALARKVEKCKGSLSAQEMGNALYGLRGMVSDDVEVRSLVSALATKVASCSESLTGQEVGNALYGLQGMSSNDGEVRSLVSALVKKVESCDGPLTGQNVGCAVYGLQGMSSDSAEVRSLVSALATKVESCSESLKAHRHQIALNSLDRMSSDHVEVRSLISALKSKMQ
jgi:tryptophan synthase alpha subunit